MAEDSQPNHREVFCVDDPIGDHLPKTTEMYVDNDSRMGSSTSILAGRARQVSTILPRLLAVSSDFARNAQLRVKRRMWLALLARRTGA